MSGEADDSGFTKITDDEIALDAFEGQGARGAWRAYAYCRARGLPFPGWVLRYLDRTAENIERYVVRDRPLSLWKATGLYDEKKASAYESERDPENAWPTIRDWQAEGVVKDESAGIRRYIAEVLKDDTPFDTVKTWCRVGRKRWNAHPPPPDAEHY